MHACIFWQDMKENSYDHNQTEAGSKVKATIIVAKWQSSGLNVPSHHYISIQNRWQWIEKSHDAREMGA